MVIKKISNILRNYCENTSLVGLGYICNQKIHLTERLFWLICIIISAGGSYYLIREYQNSFESKAISLVLESTRLQDKSQLSAVGVCEEKEDTGEYEKVREFIKDLGKKNGVHNYETITNDDIEEFLLRVIFLDYYFFESYKTLCQPNLDCSDCMKCPASGYSELDAKVRANCSELFTDCMWNGNRFNCCHYFLPMQTSIGRCFVLNSIQTTTRDSPYWFKTEIGWDAGDGELKIEFKKPVGTFIMNPEDMPYGNANPTVNKIKEGVEVDLQMRSINIINDPGVRDVSPEHRRCRFPDEHFADSGYEFYSFSSCLFNCLKELQLKACGCVHYTYIVKSDEITPTCDLNGYICLDLHDLIYPRPDIFRSWNSKSYSCSCLPSCTENEIFVFQSTRRSFSNNSMRLRIKQSKAIHQFRRQAVRTRLDVVVTIGGILGLFLGASILSGMEIFFFLLVRIFNLKH